MAIFCKFQTLIFCKYNKKKTSKHLEVFFFNLNTIQRTDFRLLAQPDRKKQTEESFAMWQPWAAIDEDFQAFFFQNLSQLFLAK